MLGFRIGGSVNPSREEIVKLLKSARTIAVVGLSSNPMRPSHGVSAYMQSEGYRIVPVNPMEQEVLGQTSYGSLAEVPGDAAIDIVDIFRRPQYVPEIVDAAIARGGIKAIWMQEGVANEAAAEKARQAGMLVIQDACILKMHRRLVA